MAKIKRVDRGNFRVENKDDSVSWMIDHFNPDRKRIIKTFSILLNASPIHLQHIIKCALLTRLKLGARSEYVFTYQEKPVKGVKTALRKACEKAGLVYGKDIPGGVTFHTLRHTHGIERQLERFLRGKNL